MTILALTTNVAPNLKYRHRSLLFSDNTCNRQYIHRNYLTLSNYEIAILLKMYDEQMTGKPNCKATEKVRSKINWQEITSACKIRKSFDAIARGLVKRMLLSDDGKSMKVLCLDKLGVSFVVGYIKQNPNAFKDLEGRLDS